MDPSRVAATVLTVTTAAIVSIRSLSDTIKGFKGRNNTLRRLQIKLHDLAAILNALVQVVDADTSVLLLLGDPINRCKEICTGFERSMTKFHGKSTTGLLDWTKLEFMRGDINDFIDTIEGYKSTIKVGLETIKLRNSKVSREVLRQHEETIKDTAYNLEVHLLRIDEELTLCTNRNVNTPDTLVDLQNERMVTQQCLRVCDDASSYVKSLVTRESASWQDASQNNARSDKDNFEAQTLFHEAFNASQSSLIGVIDGLAERLQTMIMDGSVEDEDERVRLQEDIKMSKQCLHVYKLASEISSQKIHKIGETVAEDDSDQVVVTTLADLFDVRKAESKGRSAQLVATLTPENFDHVIVKRYDSRFGALSDRRTETRIGGSTTSMGNSHSQSSKQSTSTGAGKDAQLIRQEARRDKPSPNEMKKRREE